MSRPTTQSAKIIMEPILYRDKNILKLIFSTPIKRANETKYSPEYTLDGFTLLQVKAQVENSNGSQAGLRRTHEDAYGNAIGLFYPCSYYIQFKKTVENDEQIYTLKVSSAKIVMGVKHFLSDDTSWRKLGETPSCSRIDFDITMEVDLQSSNSPFQHLYDELTDFEISGKGGSISFHKAVLAGYSPVIKRMLTSPCDFNEKVNNKMECSATKKTLEHLKSYMYLQQLPEDGLEELAVLASYYGMTDLVTKCSIKLLFNLNNGNTLSLLELAANHKLNKLTIGILKNVEMGFIKVNNLEYTDVQ